jgi:hypothetical protein
LNRLPARQQGAKRESCRRSTFYGMEKPLWLGLVDSVHSITMGGAILGSGIGGGQEKRKRGIPTPIPPNETKISDAYRERGTIADEMF